ncbi:restriction endonuclease subunit S [Salinibacter ruber]|uniref:restriction endonuclease subunit S n=1 Tax=Salinibacter ruber TaxID=146919 RepID=UPI000E593050|nr:restriction endonuclease subunit S [Salinibacter ruber]
MTLQNLLDRFDLLMDTPESVPKLRQFILQVAIQGHLSERNPNDTPAEVLLEQIQHEKQQLYDAGEIRKPKTVADVDESDKAFAVPRFWTWTRLNKIALGLRYGYTASAKEKEEGVRFLRITDIQDNSVEWTEVPSCDIGDDEIEKYRIREGDLLVARTGGTIGKTFLMPKVPVEAVCASYLIRIRPSPQVSSSFVKRYLESPLYWRQLSEASSGTGQPNVNSTALRELAVPLPPLEEQQRIVEAVGQLMDECDALEEQQEREHALQVQAGTAATEALQSADDAETLRPAWERVRGHFDTVTATPEGVDALRQTILQLAVQGRLTERDPDDTPADVLLEEIQQEKQRLYDAGEIRKPGNYSQPDADERLLELPSSWQWTRIGSICLESLYGPRYNKEEYVEEGTPTIRTTDMTERGEINLQDPPRIDVEEEELAKHRVLEGDLLVTRSGSIGTMAVFRHDYEAIPSAYLIRFRFPSQVIPEFVRAYLNSTYGQDLLGLSENSTAQPNVNGTSIKEMQFPLPSVEEQQRIVDTIDHLLSFCDDLEDLLSETGEHGEQLLEAALTDVSVDQQNGAPTGVTA